MLETFGVSNLFSFVRQVSGFVRGVNGYGVVTVVSTRRLGLGSTLGIILVTYLVQLQVLFHFIIFLA